MTIDVAFLPRDLALRGDEQRVVVVFDVLRATTSMTAALAAGIEEIRIFDSLAAAKQAAAEYEGARLLCGEERCLRAEGFDLGNSPAEFTADYAGKTVFMSTTNGTRAIVAARGANTVLIGALVNASEVARAIVHFGRDVTLLCAGTNGVVAMEDILGAGAVIDALRQTHYVHLGSDGARIAVRLFHAARNDLRPALAQAQGGQNVIRARLDADIDFAAALDSLPLLGIVRPDPLRVNRLNLP